MRQNTTGTRKTSTSKYLKAKVSIDASWTPWQTTTLQTPRQIALDGDKQGKRKKVPAF